MIQSKFNSDNIIKVIDFGYINGSQIKCIVMELAEGGTL